jgi:hypothetical protein
MKILAKLELQPLDRAQHVRIVRGFRLYNEICSEIAAIAFLQKPIKLARFFSSNVDSIAEKFPTAKPLFIRHAFIKSFMVYRQNTMRIPIFQTDSPIMFEAKNFSFKNATSIRLPIVSENLLIPFVHRRYCEYPSKWKMKHSELIMVNGTQFFFMTPGEIPDDRHDSVELKAYIRPKVVLNA